MFVIFEGLDKAGKTTLEWELLRKTNYQEVVIDRGPVGYVVYDKIFKREKALFELIELNDLINHINKSKFFVVVYCYADDYVTLQRLKDHDESINYDISKANKLLKREIEMCYDLSKTLFLDTTNKTIDECVNLIVDFVEGRKQLIAGK